MRWQLRRILTLCAAGVTAAACTDQSTSDRAPTAPSNPLASVEAAAVVPFATLSCDFTALKADARDYATSNRDLLFTIIGDLQSLAKTGPNPAATNKVFDGLARLAAMRGTSAQKPGGVTVVGPIFDRLTHRLLGCAESYIITGAVQNDFAGAVGPGWMYEVRGGSGDLPDDVYERGATGSYWATETPVVPEAGTVPAHPATWAQTLKVTAPGGAITSRALIYGFRPASFATNDPQISRFEHFTIPAITGGSLTLTPAVNIGLCNIQSVPATLRVQHVNEVLTYKGLRCTAAPAFVARSTSAVFASIPAMVDRALGLFTPRPLEASMLVGAVGGSKGELSPSAVIDIQQVTPKFQFPILDGNNVTELHGTDGAAVKVVVTTKGTLQGGVLVGTPLPNVIVKLEVSGNSSLIAFFAGPLACSDGTCAVQTTDATGTATFTGLRLTKAGGYTLVATGTFDTGLNALTSPGVVSNAFNIQNKK